MSKEYYKKKIIDLRADIAREKEQKKRDNERYASLIKGASSPSSKAPLADKTWESTLLSRSGGVKGLTGSGAVNFGVSLE